MTSAENSLARDLEMTQRLIQNGRFDEALGSIEDILSDASRNIDALYMKIVCMRYLGRNDEAFSVISELKTISPEFGRAYQEEGHLLKKINDTSKALAAYQWACQYNPALVASWTAQAELMKQLNMPQVQINAILAQVQRIKSLPKELVAVINYVSENKLLKAENICRVYLKRNPKDTEGMRLLAQIGEQFGALDEAEFLLESAVEFEPEKVQLRLDYIQILRKRQKPELAMQQSKELLKQHPENTVFLAQMGISYMRLGDFKSALKYFEKVRTLQPENAANLTSMGHAFKTDGQLEAGIEAYRAAYKARQDHGEAYFSLSNLKTYKFTDSEKNFMRNRLKQGSLTYRDSIHMNFAFAKACEDIGEYETAFTHYRIANDLGRQQMRYESEKMTAELTAPIKYCKKALFEQMGDKGHPAADPIFIVGLPRAGSTLLEQIIASHSQVDGTMELGNILGIAHKLRGRSRSVETSQYPNILNELTEEQLQKFGKQYIDETQIHRKGAAFFIDKMPNNFRHVGLIKLILPNAKIIDARRHPMACCFSGFKQHFAEGQEFTYGLEQIGKYYRDYVALMDHWDEVLPGQVLRVEYEDVVGDVEIQVHRILDFLKLPFEEACVEFHKTKRSVRTPSSEQVRQPIFKSGLEQWRNFEPWLEPLKEALSPQILKRYPI